MIQRQDPKPRTELSRLVSVLPRPHTSTSVEHDTSEAIGSYIPNAVAINAINAFIARIGSGTAMSITGPYGSGKSTFGIVLSYLVAPKADPGWEAAYGMLRGASPEAASALLAHRKAARIHSDGMVRCVATARLEPVSVTILRAVDGGAKSRFGQSYGRRHFDEAGTLRRCIRNLRRGAIPDAVTVSRIITSMARATPILLVIDEFGKNIEYFAAGGADGDLFLLQELAEMSGPSRPVPLHIVTVQHMAFGEYVAGKHAGRMREWAKVQGRFEDIHFSNSLEHARAMIASCIRPNVMARRSIAEWAAKRAEDATEVGINFRADVAAACYPLHPLTVEALPELCARYGQNDRTLLSFVAGGGPGTVARFVETERWNGAGQMPSMGMDYLYDYFISEQATARYGAASRLMEISTIIRDAGDLSPAEISVLKTVGLLNLIGRSGRLRASLGVIRCAAGSDADAAVRILEERSLITYRRHADEYRVWHGTDVNIAAKLDVWRKAGRDMTYAGLMGAAIRPEPVVAARHATETGTLRIFKCVFDGQELDLGMEYDGVVVYGDPDTRFPECDRPVVVARCPDVSEMREAAGEVLALRSVLGDEEVDRDWVSKGEIIERLAAAENALHAAFDRAYGQMATWSFSSAAHEAPTEGPASPAASRACDGAYTLSPPIRNEMINRNRLTAQGSTALNRLMAAIIERPSLPVLGMDGWKPERAVYEAILREYGLHAEDGDSWILSRPRGGDLAPAWNAALKTLRRTKKAVPISEIFGIWRLPPYGLKAGVMPLLALLIAASMRANIAVYEHGTYTPSLSASAAERLVKNPQHFSLKYFRRTAIRMDLIRQAAGALGINPKRGVLGIVGHIVGVARSLPVYTRKTSGLDPKTLAVRDAVLNAVQPDTLLFESVPAALGFKTGTDIVKSDVPALAAGLAMAVNELTGAFDAMRRWMLNRLLAETKAADRTSLSEAASSLLPGVSDQKMRVFLGALAASIPDDLEWTSYVALALTGHPPTEWSDEHAGMFENGLREAAVGYMRLAALKFGDVAGSLDGPSVMVTITHPDGFEERVILPAGDKKVVALTDG